MSLRDIFGLAAVALGIIGYALNYVTYYIAREHERFKIDDGWMYMLAWVNIPYTVMLICSTCWAIGLFK